MGDAGGESLFRSLPSDVVVETHMTDVNGALVAMPLRDDNPSDIDNTARRA
jgi:hypothetical protein